MQQIIRTTVKLTSITRCTVQSDGARRLSSVSVLVPCSPFINSHNCISCPRSWISEGQPFWRKPQQYWERVCGKKYYYYFGVHLDDTALFQLIDPFAVIILKESPCDYTSDSRLSQTAYRRGEELIKYATRMHTKLLSLSIIHHIIFIYSHNIVAETQYKTSDW